MECTQRLECTQDLYDTHTEKVCPEQIGFLGILGAKHPVLKGPNKIGRDPQTCSIILNLNSVSRQHAVINVLNSKEFMLMDLDSANKTKLLNKTLQPYIPHPMRDGDTVQFGDIFGVFRLLEQDDDLPMTQAIDIPETPVPPKHVSKLHKAPTTIVPESPDVSDRDDSFITPSQPVGGKLRLSNSSLTKPNNKTISTLPDSSPKTYINRKSVKRSTSLSFNDNPNTSLNESLLSLKTDKDIIDNIHEVDTQVPNPVENESTDSIYTADTQIPPEHMPSPSIHNLDTQVPTEHLPQVRKIDGQHEMQLDIYADNKENNRDIFNAETQPFGYENDAMAIVNRNKSNLTNKTKPDCANEESKEKINSSEEELLFDDVDDEIIGDDFNSQNILPEEFVLKENAKEQTVTTESLVPAKRDTRVVSDGSTDCEDIGDDMLLTQKIPELPSKEKKQQAKLPVQNKPKPSKRTARINSDSSTDCEDIDLQSSPVISKLPDKKDAMKENADKKPVKRVNRIKSDSSTDCEDMDIDLTQKILEKKDNAEDDVTDCEDDLIEIKTKEKRKNNQTIDNKKNKIPFEEMATQIIDICDDPTDVVDVPFEDQATQVIDIIVPVNKTQVKKPFNEIVSPFKIPLQSPIRIKSKDIPKITPKEKIDNSKVIELDDNYYDATQDIYADLCSQNETNDVIKGEPNADDEVVPCSVEDYKVKDITENIEKGLLSPTRKVDRQTSLLSKNLTGQEKKNTVGVHTNVAKLIKVPSDSSDVESTPTKARGFMFTDSDLPDSQEIKKSIMSHIRPAVTESSSESEAENCSEDQFTPIIPRKKKTKPIAQVDLSTRFGIEKLPERVITRQRKPTYKLMSSAAVSKQNATSILKPSYLAEQEEQIDGDIITENIKRLKTYEKAKSNKDSKNNESANDDKKESTSKKKTDNKNKEPKEKIKVKIEKPKRKDGRSKTETAVPKSDESDKNDSKKEKLDSTTTSTATTRRTRSRKNEIDNTKVTKKSTSPENNKKEQENKRKRPNKKQEKERSTSPEIEVRRSKRNQKSKENDVTTNAPKSILKKSIHEQSTVYNISSSSAESPRSLKRSLVEDGDAPSPKRTRAFNSNNNNSINSASLRATPARAGKTQRVLLTAFPSVEVQQKLVKLGAVVVTDVFDCTVVLTMQIKRTFKLLCAVGLGLPIVGPSWVQACADTNIIVDPWLYLVQDESAEKRFQFSLQKTLQSKRNFLKGHNVSSTPNVLPNGDEMKLIVECSGGTWKEGGPNWVCVSCPKDKDLWHGLRKRGATVVSTEFILGGVLKQKIDIDNNKFP